MRSMSPSNGPKCSFLINAECDPLQLSFLLIVNFFEATITMVRLFLCLFDNGGRCDIFNNRNESTSMEEISVAAFFRINPDSAKEHKKTKHCLVQNI